MIPKPYDEIHAERIRAHDKHDHNGGSMERKDWSHPIWLAVVGEEFGEVARVLCEDQLGNEPKPAMALRGELVQLGAMVAAWIDAIDRAGWRPIDPAAVLRRLEEHAPIPDIDVAISDDDWARACEAVDIDAPTAGQRRLVETLLSATSHQLGGAKTGKTVALQLAVALERAGVQLHRRPRVRTFDELRPYGPEAGRPHDFMVSETAANLCALCRQTPEYPVHQQ